MNKKLDFELVPDSCWYSNLRTLFPKEVWETIKKISKKNACGKCSICGKLTNRLETHESWEYDEKNHIQKLVGIIAVCKDCHSVIHIGFTQLKGDIERAENHYMKVNECSYSEYRKALGEANEIHKRRNLVPEWELDVSYVKKYFEENL
jgi:hypothetical protein